MAAPPMPVTGEGEQHAGAVLAVSAAVRVVSVDQGQQLDR